MNTHWFRGYSIADRAVRSVAVGALRENGLCNYADALKALPSVADKHTLHLADRAILDTWAKVRFERGDDADITRTLLRISWVSFARSLGKTATLGEGGEVAAARRLNELEVPYV